MTKDWTHVQVKELRRRLRLTQDEFAKLCKVARPTVSFWELDWQRPSLTNLKTLDAISAAEAAQN